MSTEDTVYPRPIATVDLVILALSPRGLEVMLIRRGAAPFAGEWALPGGWVHVDEDTDVDEAARRVLAEKTGVRTPYLEQLQSFGSATRDPRGWSLSIAYVALMSVADVRHDQDRTEDIAWALVEGEGVPQALAFDHAAILRAALARVRKKVEYSSLPVHLLPSEFTLGELQAVYEQLLDHLLDKSAFRKRIAESKFVEPVLGKMRHASNRPAQIYQVKPDCPMILFDRAIDVRRVKKSPRSPRKRSSTQ